jgi:phosphohistidine phosphatase
VPRLWVLRHAKSSWDDTSLADHDRPLAPRGRRACRALRRHCSTAAVLPELVLCSSALRARETLEALLPVLGDPEVVVEDGLYLASAHTLLTRVRVLDVESALLVGHNPGLHELVVALAQPGTLRDRAAEKLPTGALATLELEEWRDLGPGRAALTGYVTPHELD